jgi:hypothetical protein
MDEKSTRHLDKDFVYVIYCDGIGCNASIRGIKYIAAWV